MKKSIKLLVLAMICFVGLPLISKAQPVPDSNDVDLPIDGGISLLVAAGAAVGAKKIRDARKK